VAIPEAQLERWAKQGPTGQFTDTYETIRQTLHGANAPYAAREFSTFLQGSYANDTNVYADSDVDIVMRLDEIYYTDLDRLPPADKELHDSQRAIANYTLPAFKAEVLAWLSQKFSGVTQGKKAILIPGNGNRRDADVLVCALLRRYHKFRGWNDQTYVEGIRFFASDGTAIDNFPKQHSANCTTKHGVTKSWFKPTVRIFKNIRNKLIDDNKIPEGLAPSYFIEGLLYNVPDHRYGGNYTLNVADVLKWLLTASDKSNFLCANEQFYLFRGPAAVIWSPQKCDQFLIACATLWDNW
jgi:hypothetical protein